MNRRDFLGVSVAAGANALIGIDDNENGISTQPSAQQAPIVLEYPSVDELIANRAKRSDAVDDMGEDCYWYGWDAEKQDWHFRGTENYVWGQKHGFTKRIGDMSREELMQVIATGYSDREWLAENLLTAIEHAAQLGISAKQLGVRYGIKNAGEIVKRNGAIGQT